MEASDRLEHGINILHTPPDLGLHGGGGGGGGERKTRNSVHCLSVQIKKRKQNKFTTASNTTITTTTTTANTSTANNKASFLATSMPIEIPAWLKPPHCLLDRLNTTITTANIKPAYLTVYLHTA